MSVGLLLMCMIIFYGEISSKGSRKVTVARKLVDIGNKQYDELMKQKSDEEDFYFMQFQNDKNSPEILAHTNRVFQCLDHPVTKNICLRANTSTFCHDYEVYAFSFCRMSCGFCSEIDNEKHLIWRVVPATPYKPTWPISEINFFASYPLVNLPQLPTKVYASSSYSGYDPEMAFDKNNATYWIPERWGYHEPESDWIGGNFYNSSKINAVQIYYKTLDGVEFPKAFHIESSPALNQSFIHRWTFFTNKDEKDAMIIKPTCKPMWRVYTTNTSVRCYRIFWKNVSWEVARTDCDSTNSSLLSIHNKLDLRMVLTKPLTNISFWSGMNSLQSPNDFTWSDGTQVDYQNWESDESTGDSTKKCAIVNKNGNLEKVDCNESYIYICTHPYGKNYLSLERYIPQHRNFSIMKLDSPMLFSSDNYYEPIINNTQNQDKIDNAEKIEWPELARIPILSDLNTTYANRVEKMANKLLWHTFNNSISVNESTFNTDSNFLTRK